MLEQIVWQAPFFLLVAVRCFALIMTMPLFSMRTISRVAKIALTGYMAYLIFPFSIGFSFQEEAVFRNQKAESSFILPSDF